MTISKEAIDTLCRPIVGIENRTPLEVQDIMSDRIRSFLSTLPIAGEGKDGLVPAKAAEFSRMVREYRANSDNDHGARMQEDLEMFLMENLCEIEAALISSPGKDGGQEVEAEGDLREALQRLEDCCDQLAGTRSREVYDAMINSGQADAMTDLDNARLNARKVLSLTASSPVQDTVAVVTGDAALALGLPEGTKLYTRPQPASTALVERLGLAWAAVGHHEGIAISVHADAADTWNALCAILDPLARSALSASTSREGESE